MNARAETVKISGYIIVKHQLLYTYTTQTSNQIVRLPPKLLRSKHNYVMCDVSVDGSDVRIDSQRTRSFEPHHSLEQIGTAFIKHQTASQ